MNVYLKVCGSVIILNLITFIQKQLIYVYVCEAPELKSIKSRHLGYT